MQLLIIQMLWLPGLDNSSITVSTFVSLLFWFLITCLIASIRECIVFDSCPSPANTYDFGFGISIFRFNLFFFFFFIYCCDGCCRILHKLYATVILLDDLLSFDYCDESGGVSVGIFETDPKLELVNRQRRMSFERRNWY